MPLKHATETLLVFVLAVVLLLTGVVLHLLPAPPAGLFMWAVAFVLTLAYPLLLYPLLRKRRADYSLRALHFLPALFLLLWFLAAMGAGWLRPLSLVRSVLQWGLGLAPVATGMALLLWYCFSVIRQRATRAPLLAVLFVPFMLLGLSTEWNGWTTGGLTAATASSASKAQANLAPSDSPRENNWRGMLRRMERREARLQRNQDPFAASSVIATAQSSSKQLLIAAKSSDASSSPPSTYAASTARSSAKTVAVSSRTEVDAPPALSSTGLGTGSLAVFLGAGYFTVLQRRAMRRKA